MIYQFHVFFIKKGVEITDVVFNRKQARQISALTQGEKSRIIVNLSKIARDIKLSPQSAVLA